MGCDSLSDKEIMYYEVTNYSNLQRIKRSLKEENEELEYQIRVSEAKLHSMGVNLQDLEL